MYRISSLDERRGFYEKEFSVSKVKSWFKKNKIPFPQLCAVDAGSETGILIDKKLKGSMLYFPFSKLWQKVLKYIPEDVYYDRSVYKNPAKALRTLNFNNKLGQELVFDVDTDNIPCKFHKKELVCDICLRKALGFAKKIKKILLKEFKRVEIVYSGRGFHVHVFDKKAYSLDNKQRQKYNKKFVRFPIDPLVSRGNIRLIRMPFSLNSLVSRIVTPLDDKNRLNNKTIPKFLKN